MVRNLVIAATLFATILPAAPAAAHFGRQDQAQAREERRDGQRVDLGSVVRRVSAGRQGRMLGVSERGSGDRLVYVIRWEYPGGRVVDITVDGRTGAIIGER